MKKKQWGIPQCLKQTKDPGFFAAENPRNSSEIGGVRFGESMGYLGGETCKYFLFSPRKLGKISNLTSIFRWVETTN